MSDLKANPGATLLAEIAARECTNNRATGQTCDESDAWVRDYKRRNGMKEEGSIVTRCDPCRARAALSAHLPSSDCNCADDPMNPDLPPCPSHAPAAPSPSDTSGGGTDR